MLGLLLATPANAGEFPPDVSGCVYGSPPDSDADGVPDVVELAEGDPSGDSDRDACPDINDPDDDGDGLPTRAEDLNDNGNWLDDTERVRQDGFPPAFLDEDDPFDDDGDGFLDMRHAALLAALGAFGDDCNDSYDIAFPGNDQETWYNGVDEDCSLTSDYDQDGDGHCAEERKGDDACCDLDEEGRPVDCRVDDCDDEDADSFPGNVEDDGPADRDCNGFSDPERSLEPRGGCACSGAASRAGVSAVATLLVSLAVVSLAAARRRTA